MRKPKLPRTTTETDIRVSLNLDGQGRAKISTGIPFLDHMLTLVARHGAMDLELTARGEPGCLVRTDAERTRGSHQAYGGCRHKMRGRPLIRITADWPGGGLVC